MMAMQLLTDVNYQRNLVFCDLDFGGQEGVLHLLWLHFWYIPFDVSYTNESTKLELRWWMLCVYTFVSHQVFYWMTCELRLPYLESLQSFSDISTGR